MNAGRRGMILGVLRNLRECSVAQLAAECGVSEMTVRRDLADLAAEGRVIRTHGGAALSDRVSFEFKFLQRTEQNASAKSQIAWAAAQRVEAGQTVLLDSGTTTLAVGRALRGLERLTVITTSLPIASELQYCPGMEIILLGGRLRADAPDLEGTLTLRGLELVHADVAFVGADAIDNDGRTYSESLEVAHLLERMCAAASCVYVVADSSKMGKTALGAFGSLAQCSGLITDGAITRERRKAIEKNGGKIITNASSE